MSQANVFTAPHLYDGSAFACSAAGLWPAWWITTLLTLGLVVIVIPVDAAGSAWIAQAADDGTWARRILKLARYPFNWWVYAAIGVLLFGQHRQWRPVIGLLTATLGCMASVHLLKFLLGRARPDCGLGAYHFAVFGDPVTGFDSMPSGHTAQAVLLAVLMLVYLPRSAWVLVPLAVLASLSRVAQERHFLSDLIAAAGVAVLTVKVSMLALGPSAFPRLRLRKLSIIARAGSKPATRAA